MTAIDLSSMVWPISPDNDVAGYLSIDPWAKQAPDTSMAAHAQRALLERILAAAKAASVDNWDAEGARAVDHATIRFAQMFSSYLPPRMALPDVSPDKDGDLAFDWDYDRRRIFSVSVRRDGMLYFAGIDGTDRFEGATYLLRGNLERILDGISSVAGG